MHFIKFTYFYWITANHNVIHSWVQCSNTNSFSFVLCPFPLLMSPISFLTSSLSLWQVHLSSFFPLLLVMVVCNNATDCMSCTSFQHPVLVQNDHFPLTFWSDFFHSLFPVAHTAPDLPPSNLMCFRNILTFSVWWPPKLITRLLHSQDSPLLPWVSRLLLHFVSLTAWT